jgi:membrane protease YdiL (CAAX protease family)
MSFEKSWRVFLGSFILLIVSYLIYFIRYPMWKSFVSVEVISVLLMLSYLIVLLIALFLLKKDSKKSLSSVFRNKGNLFILIGLAFGLIYLGLFYFISFLLGSTFEFTSFPNLTGFESYAVYSVWSAFILYLSFSVFGAFAEEVAYRGYVQTRISGRYGYLIGILVSSLFFSLQHIHVFQVSWLVQFFQMQFFHVFLFGIFGGYLFFKSNENIWSVFAMHALGNVFSVSLPIIVTHAFPFTFYVAEIVSFAVMILLLRYLPLKNKLE